MNKKTILRIFAICVVLLVLGVIVNDMEQNKQNPQERNTMGTQNTANLAETSGLGNTEEWNEIDGDSVSKDDADAWKSTSGDCTIRHDNLRIDFLSCDIIEDTSIEHETKYPAKYFVSGMLPDDDFTEITTNWDAVYKEAPEYEKASKTDCTNDEQLKKYLKIKEKYQDIIDKYTTEDHPKTRYYFIKCKIMNETSESIESSLYLMGLSSLGEQISLIEGCIYFDKSEHLEGEDRLHSYFIRMFEPGETLECTLGFEISQEFGYNETYYIGEVPNTDGTTYNPNKLPDLVKLSNIPDAE